MSYKKYISTAWLTIGGTPIQSPGGMDNVTPEAAGPLGENIFQLALSLMLLVAVLLSLFFLIRGGIAWILSGGDPKAIDAAKRRIYFAIIGLVLAFCSFLIIRVIGNFFGVDLILNHMLPGETT